MFTVMWLGVALRICTQDYFMGFIIISNITNKKGHFFAEAALNVELKLGLEN